ncbi:hypothetical protein WDZ17_02825 [Pseudokineococcus basanitobsidens]|uniref:DUF559 domain-containing protein n=1 Tax=Pseudokineococcus basanitobsidens TaxID=1926649 RepID=A0ABU8RGL5_9ACTN
MRELELPDGVLALARAQSGCVARRQLREHGVGPDVVRRRTGSRRWQRAGPRVVVLHTGPLDPGARRWAALLHVGPGAALAAWTALGVHGLQGWPRDEVHVAVPRGGSRTPQLPGLVVHLAHRDGRDEVTSRAGLPLHGVERAALDAASWSAAPRAAGGVLAATVQQRLTTPARLRTCLRARGPVRHRALLAAVVEDLAGGSQSMAEVDLVRLCRRSGLPVPVRQSLRTDLAGRRRYLDAEWVLPDGRRVLLEVDGVGHVEVRGWYDDLLRAAEVSRAGETVLRLPALALRVDAERVVALLRVHLGSSGSGRHR